MIVLRDVRLWIAVALAALLLMAASMFSAIGPRADAAGNLRLCADRETGAVRMPLPKYAGCGGGEFTITVDHSGFVVTQ